MKKITCFVPYIDESQAGKTLSALRNSQLVDKVVCLDEPVFKSETIRRIAAESKADYALVYTKTTTLELHGLRAAFADCTRHGGGLGLRRSLPSKGRRTG